MSIKDDFRSTRGPFGPGSRKNCAVEAIEVGENTTECGYCGNHTELWSVLLSGERHETCTGCAQHYIVTDALDEAEADRVDSLASAAAAPSPYKDFGSF